MNRCIRLLLLLLMSSCGLISDKKNNSTTVIANFSTNAFSESSINLKLKTHLYRDSTVVQVNPLVGFSLAEILIKDDIIDVTNKLTNKKSTFSIFDFDPDLNLKKLLRLVIKKKDFNDTTYYQNPNVKYMFCDYVNIEIENSKNKVLSLPRQIKLNRTNQLYGRHKIKMMIDYKLVKLNK